MNETRICDVCGLPGRASGWNEALDCCTDRSCVRYSISFALIGYTEEEAEAEWEELKRKYREALALDATT